MKAGVGVVWVAWRQQRAQLLTTLGLILGAALVLVWLRLDATSYLAAAGATDCWTTMDGCPVADELALRYETFRNVYPMVGLALPALLGLFAGAPMFAREIERGTHVFGLTQSIGRSRWWLTKALVGGGPVVLGAAALGLIAAWALEPLRAVLNNRFMTPMFETQGLVVGAYTLLAVVLGIAAGLWVRTTVAAMAVTLALYLGVMVGLTNGVREVYAAPLYTTGSIETDAPAQPELIDAWRIRTGLLDTAGREVGIPRSCLRRSDGGVPGRTELTACLRANGLVTTYAWYQPNGRFWLFQLVETGVVVLLSLLALGAGTIAVARRLT